jgi:anti-sigma factor RsiW
MTDAHPSPDTLAEHGEDLLEPAAAAEVSAHLLECGQCREYVEELRAVSRVLAGVGDPGPLPEDVAQRLELALAAPGAAAVHADYRDQLAARRAQAPARQSRLAPVLKPLLGAAAAVAVVAGAVAGLGAMTRGGGDSEDSATSLSADEGADAAPEAAMTGAPPVTASGRDYARGDVAAAGVDLLAGLPPYDRAADVPQELTGSRDSATPASAALSLTARLAALRACEESLGAPPLGIDAARYEGRPAWLVVVPDPGGDPAATWAYVVPEGCPEGPPLYAERLPAG